MSRFEIFLGIVLLSPTSTINRIYILGLVWGVKMAWRDQSKLVLSYYLVMQSRFSLQLTFSMK